MMEGCLVLCESRSLFLSRSPCLSYLHKHSLPYMALFVERKRVSVCLCVQLCDFAPSCAYTCKWVCGYKSSFKHNFWMRKKTRTNWQESTENWWGILWLWFRVYLVGLPFKDFMNQVSWCWREYNTHKYSHYILT